MTKYKALTEMGIQHPEEIERYALYTVETTDILRIIYKRKKGSILPVSRKYKFERIKKTTMVDSGTRTAAIVYESAPAFRYAVEELDQLIEARAIKQDSRSLIVDEVRLLEEDVASRIDYIKSLIEKI